MKNIKDFNSFISESKTFEYFGGKAPRSNSVENDMTDYRNKIEEVINDQFTPEEKHIEILDKFEDKIGTRSGKIITNIMVNRPNDGEKDFNVSGRISIGNSSHSPAYVIDIHPNITVNNALWRENEDDYMSNESIDKIVKIATIINTYVKVDQKLFDKIVDRMYSYFSESYLKK